jgi:tetratricopeptide (TPR) repeat protein
MTQTADNWREQAKAELRRLKEVVQAGASVPVYGAAAALALWPVVQAWQLGGAAAVDNLLGVAAGAGLAVITQPVLDWLAARREKQRPSDEAALAAHLSALAAGDADIRDALDAQLEQLQAFQVATRELDEATIDRLVDTLRVELRALGNDGRFAGTLTVIQTGGGAYVAGDVNTDEFVGGHKITYGDDIDINQPQGVVNIKPNIFPPPLPTVATPDPAPPLDPDGRPPLFAPGPLPAHHRLPLPANPLFTGREEELRDLARVLLPYDDADLRGLAKPLRSGGGVIISTGIGGVGKTQLAAEFAHRYGRFFHSVWWVSLADPANVDGEVAECGLRMGLHPAYSSLPRPDQVAAVRREWAGPEPRLLIFDNCEDPALLRDWAPLGGGARLLATSRRQQPWPKHLGVTEFPLETLTQPQSVALLEQYVNDQADRDVLAQIAVELGALPLALHLAGSFLATYADDPDTSAEALLAELRDPGRILASEALTGRGAYGSPTAHILHVANTFLLSLDRLADITPDGGRLSRQLLARAACFAPGEPLPLSLLRATIANDTGALSSRDVTDAIYSLQAVGLLERVDGDNVRLHRLLARFAAVELAGEMDMAQEAAERVVQVILDEVWTRQEPLLLSGLVGHLGNVVNVARESDESEAVKLANKLGNCLRLKGDYSAARPLYEWALAITERMLGPDHPQTAGSLNNLAELLRALGDTAAARPLYERTLAIRERALGPDHPDTATSLNNLAGLLYAQGDYAAARPLLERALAITERALGPDHPDTALSLNNLAGLLRAQGDYAEARPLYERALAIRERALGPDHPQTAASLNNLAMLLRAQGDAAAARPLYERALAIFERALGPDHPNTATSLNNLAELLRAQGDTAAARPLYERALAIKERALGPDHPQTALSLNNLAALLRAQGDLAAARPLYERALAIRERALGPDHPDTAISYGNLGSLLVAIGDGKAGRAFLLQALEVFVASLGTKHPHTLETVRRLVALDNVT